MYKTDPNKQKPIEQKKKIENTKMDEIAMASHDQCVIELVTGRKIIAEFRYFSSSHDYVVVENVMDPGNRMRTGQHKYYKAEIVSIEKLIAKLPEPTKRKNCRDDAEPQTNDKCQGVSIIKHDGDEILDRMVDLATKAVFITQCDKKYHEALQDLDSQDVIAVVCSSENHLGRLDVKKPLVAIATAQNVYIFDMLCIGRVHRELERILGAVEPRKVVFNSAKVNDYFAHKENCQIKIHWDILVRLRAFN